MRMVSNNQEDTCLIRTNGNSIRTPKANGVGAASPRMAASLVLHHKGIKIRPTALIMRVATVIGFRSDRANQGKL